MGAAASAELADAIGAAPGGMAATHASRKGGNARASAKVQPVWDEGEDDAIERKARQLEQLKDRVNAAIASGSRVKQLLEDEVRRDLGLSAIRLRFTANGALEHCSLFSEPGGRHGCNQDSMIAWEDFNVPEIAGRVKGRMPPGAASDVIFCAVFDGHGPNGHLVSQRVRDSLPSRIASLLAPPPVATVSPYGHLDKSAPPMAPASDQLLQRLGVNGGSSKSKGSSGKVHPLGVAPGYGGGGDGGSGGFGMTLQRSRSANSLENSAPRGSVSPYHSTPSSASSAAAAAAAAAAEASREASKAQVERAFRRAFLEMDDELRSHPHVDGHVSGSTAVVAALLGRRLVVASIGDSRAVLAYRCKAGHAAPGTAPAINGMQCKPLTNDHKCSVASERKRIEQAGGRVQASEHEPWTPRIWLPRERSPGLVPSRAFGDFVVKVYGVIAEPDILIRHLTSEDEFIILASDGLWDVMTPQEAMSAVLSAPTRQTAARHLIAQARSLWAAKHQSVRPDDCTAVVLFLPEFAPSGLLSGSTLPHSGPLSSTPFSGPLSSSTPYSGPLSSIPHSAPLSSFHSSGPQGYSLLQQQQQPSWQQKPNHQPQQVQLPPRQFLSQLPMPLPNLTSSDIKPVIPIPGSRFPEQRGPGVVGSGSENTWEGGAGDGAGGGSGGGGGGGGGGRRKKSSRRKSGRREAGLMSLMGAVEEGNEEAFDDTASIASIGTVCTDASFGTVIYSEADSKPSGTGSAEGVGNPPVVLTPPVCEDGFYRDDTIRVPVERQVERGAERQTEGREKENMGNGDGVRLVLGNTGQGVSSSSTSDSASLSSSDSKAVKQGGNGEGRRNVLGLFYNGEFASASASAYASLGNSKVVPLPPEGHTNNALENPPGKAPGNPPVTISICSADGKLLAPTDARVMAPPMRSRSLTALSGCIGGGMAGTGGTGGMGASLREVLGSEASSSCTSGGGGSGGMACGGGSGNGCARMADRYESLGSGAAEEAGDQAEGGLGSKWGSTWESKWESSSAGCGAAVQYAVARLGLDTVWHKCWRTEP
ncbi:unnamed protein product [Closterium sp. Naga37s-1]|nr:unnamed protein product [Closterium sp. Naga37s-1]